MNTLKRSILAFVVGFFLVGSDAAAQTLPAIPLEAVEAIVGLTAVAIEIIECPLKTERKSYMLINGELQTLFIDAVVAATDPGAKALIARLRDVGLMRGPVPIYAKCKGELST